MDPQKTASINVWDYKPWWCQPWSILLTGLGIIVGSWLILHRVWITAIASVPILVWMGYFLILFPRLVAASYAKSQNSSIHVASHHDNDAT